MLNDWRKKVSTKGKEAINARFKRLYGNTYKENRREYAPMAGRFWSEQFGMVGLPRMGFELKRIDDLDTLKAIYGNIEYELKEGNRGSIR